MAFGQYAKRLNRRISFKELWRDKNLLWLTPTQFKKLQRVTQENANASRVFFCLEIHSQSNDEWNQLRWKMGTMQESPHQFGLSYEN
jgi:hypothetical protein